MNERYILGLSFNYHDSAAALLKNGQLIAAAQEERFTRIKNDPSFPSHATSYVLKAAGITIKDVSHVAYYERPLNHLERLLYSFIETWPYGLRLFLSSLPIWLRRKAWVGETIREKLGYAGPVAFVDHHIAHAASAFFPSPFRSAAILTIDATGEWTTTAFGMGSGNDLTMHEEILYPDSLGLFYSAITAYLGFEPLSDEYKVMGLAPYGSPRFVDALKTLIHLNDDGSFNLTRRVFGWHMNPAQTMRRLEHLFGQPRRVPDGPLTDFHKDVARSLQAVLEDAVLAIARHLRARTNTPHLCFAGGVALNSVVNGRMMDEKIFESVFVPPAPGDAGAALGAALYIEHVVLHHTERFPMTHASWGPEYAPEEMEKALEEAGYVYERFQAGALCEKVSRYVADGAVVGWFQGRMEFGPRALGNRSILADPRKKENWMRINEAIKFRERFRPFAPSVLSERTHEYFDMEESPFMARTARVRTDALPAVTHVDHTARPQTVSADGSIFRTLLECFDRETGCGALLQTSFNRKGEPIVCSPEDALRSFGAMDLDYLVIGPFIVSKHPARV